MKEDLTPLSNVHFLSRLGLSAALGLITSLAICAHVDAIWRVSSPMRISIVLVLWLFLGYAAERTTVLLLKGLRNYGWISGIVSFVLTAGGVSILWLTSVLPLPGAQIPISIWSWVVPLADRLFFSIGIIFFTFGLLLQPAAWMKRNLLWKIGRLATIYQHDAVFVAVFLALSLLGLLHVKDISDLDQQFFYRKQLIQAHENFRLHFLGDRLLSSAIVGPNGWLIYANGESLNDIQNASPFTLEELTLIQRKLDRLHTVLTDRGISFLVVLAPNKNTIYPEMVPEELTILHPESRLDQMVAFQRKNGQAEILDLRQTLFQAAKERQVYYATDTHWNPYGAFSAYQAIMRSLGQEPLSMADYVRKSAGVRNGDISSMAGSFQMEEEYFSLSPVRQVEFIRWRAKKDDITMDIITNPNTSLPNLLMFKDSFANALIPFFGTHFHQAVYYHGLPKDDTFYDVFDPDIVIVECTERYLYYLLSLPD